MHFNQAKFYCDLNIVKLSNFLKKKKKNYNFKKIIATKLKSMHKTCITGNLSFEVEFLEVRPGLSIIITIYYCVKTIFVQFCCCIKSLLLIKLTLG